MSECVFCNIICGKIKSEKIYEDDDFLVIKDINPKAPIHCLVIPKKHYALLSQMSSSDAAVLGDIFKKIPLITKQLGLNDDYKLAINQGEKGGQEVPHLHIHILGEA